MRYEASLFSPNWPQFAYHLLRWTPSVGQHWGNVISEGPAVFPRYTNALLAGHLLSFDCSSDCTESPLNTSAGVR